MEANRSGNSEFIALLGTAVAALALDVESTKYFQRYPDAAESNSWIYGERPSRGRMYAVGLPVAVALSALAGHLKSSCPPKAKHPWAWRVPLWGLILGHGIAAATNFLDPTGD